MNSKVKKAPYVGAIKVGDLSIPCFVLEDGTRVLSGRGITGSLGLTGRGQGMSRFLEAKKLKPYINKELALAIKNPIVFSWGKRDYSGFEASILPELCNAILDADADGMLLSQQKMMAHKSRILVKAFSVLGIIALVDAATGYDQIRDREALQKILDAYISKELAAWAKRFPDEFYKEMFRLRGWQWQGMKLNRPSIVGHYTNEIVYKRLAPGVLEELRDKNPPDEKGNRASKHHQWLTTDIGHPKLSQHLSGIIALMKASDKWANFLRLVRKAYPVSGEQQEIDI